MNTVDEKYRFVPDHLLGAAELALKEGRLRWRCTDAEGRPANGGCADPLQMWEWSPYCNPILCRSGWHTTTDPLRWKGSRVFLIECDTIVASKDDKSVSGRIRPLAEVDPAMCLDFGIGIKLGRKDLAGANLCGTDLYGADLYGADLYGANLRGANLRGANLRGANLHGANLYGANLYGANLRGANLRGADLRGVDLTGADLRGANLYGADLRGADLTGANLRGADLRGAIR